MRRRELGAFLGAALLGAAARGTAADPYPTKPLRLLIGDAPGGPGDSLTRLLARELSAELKVSIVVDSRPGAKAQIAAETAARSTPDGYTLLVTNQGVLAAASAFDSKLRFDPERQLLPLARVGSFSFLLVARSSLGINSAADLIAHAKANPGRLNFAYTGETTQLAIDVLQDQGGITFNAVPYKAIRQAALDLSGGSIDLMFVDQISAAPLIQAGTVRILARSSPKKSIFFANTPTMAEVGFPDLIWQIWYALATPANVPAAVTERLSAALKVVVTSKGYVTAANQISFETFDETAEQFQAALNAERVRYKTMARKYDHLISR